LSPYNVECVSRTFYTFKLQCKSSRDYQSVLKAWTFGLWVRPMLESFCMTTRRTTQPQDLIDSFLPRPPVCGRMVVMSVESAPGIPTLRESRALWRKYYPLSTTRSSRIPRAYNSFTIPHARSRLAASLFPHNHARSTDLHACLFFLPESR
jgi:hypothetical protein